MTKIRFGSNFAVFVLFFGIAALDAIQLHDWLRVTFWAAIGLVFLFSDTKPLNR